ncbi:MAG: VOC family protein [Planctomycetaceae bacterium]|jgi:catechol 2,3-dioxygenase-like lactoylglutathione lyase family enzyme|nr:VOC family protein [Planctomycetaceae bacterium]
MKINKLTPNFAVTDIRQTVQFYCENLGFELVIAVPVTQDGVEQQLSDGKEYVYVLLKKDDIELMF